MALQKQVVRMSAEGGLDTKTDSKNVLPTNFLELENVRFTKTGRFSKRFGYDSYTNGVLNGDPVETGAAVTTFKDELLRYSETNLYSYSSAENKWADKGATKFALSSEVSVITDGNRITNPSHATIANLTCYVYDWSGVPGSGGVDYRIIDNVTGAVIYTGEVEASASTPHVVAIQGKFFIFYSLGSDILFRSVNFSTPQTISSFTTAVTATNFTVGQIGQRAYIVTPDTTGIKVSFVTEDGTINGPFSVPDGTGSFDTFSVSAEQGTSVRLVYGKSGGGTLWTALYAADMNYAVHSPLQLSASATVYNIGSVQSPTDPNKSQIYVSIASAPYKINRYDVTSGGILSSSSTPLYQATLQSKPAAYGNKVYYAVQKNTSYLQAGPTYVPFRTVFLASEDGDILNKFANDIGVLRYGVAGLPNLNVEGTKLCFCVPEATEIQSNLISFELLVPTAVKKYRADFNTLNNYFDATLGENLHIAGGVLKMHDGDRVVEHNFLLAPEAPLLVSQTTTGGVLPDGSYQYVVVYKWLDKAGQVHRSQPSLPLTYVASGGPKKPTIRVFTLPFTTKEDVEIEVYRTEVNGTTFYKRAYNYSDRIVNDKTVESRTFSDTMADSELISGETLYTEGGVLENSSASSSKAIATYKARVILLLSDGYTYQFSKKREENGPVEFADELKGKLDDFGGPSVALYVMDSNLIIFKERAIFALSGDGPNSLGEQDDFKEPQLITSDAGCVDPNSIVMTPEGLMFKSAKGIYLLGRDFTPSYIGAGVEEYNSLTITSANLLPDTNEVRFTTNSDRSLIYDYYHKRWAVDRNINAVDATIYNNKYIFLRENADLMEEDQSSFGDNGSYISMRIVSSWIQLAGIQGFERFYKMLILGAYKSKHLLKVKFSYDFDPSWVHEATIDAGDVLPVTAYGSDTFGDETPYGGEFPLYQFRIFPKQQKCEAFRFCIEDFKTDGNGEGLSLSNFAAEVGLKPTAYKKADSKSFGAS
jgi:hypothetical protein